MAKHEAIASLCRAGISYDDAYDLRLAAMTLHRWFELECGDSNSHCSWAIERDGDEPDSPPYMVTHDYWIDGKTSRRRIPDRETGARKRIAAIMAKYPNFTAYIQTDPRGAPLWIIPADRIKPGIDIDCQFTNGIAVYK